MRMKREMGITQFIFHMSNLNYTTIKYKQSIQYVYEQFIHYKIGYYIRKETKHILGHMTRRENN